MSAIISPCGLFRYTLERSPEYVRKFAERTGKTTKPDATGTVLFVMLNPSTADADNDDPTIRSCMSFAVRWGFERLLVGNLFAYRATQPLDLWRARGQGVNIVGMDNDSYLNQMANQADRVVAAWGVNAEKDIARSCAVTRLLRKRGEVYVLGRTMGGEPVHPLYQPKDIELEKIQ